MTWWRMLRVACRLAWPHLLTPWNSPLLRWRMETYGLSDAEGRPVHAEDIHLAEYAHFVRRHRRSLLRFLRWAADLPSVAR